MTARSPLALRSAAVLLALAVPLPALAQRAARRAHAPRATPVVRLVRAEAVPNLGKLKTRLTDYHDCKVASVCYERDLGEQGRRALAYLKRFASSKEKLAVVFDIDETSLSTWATIKKHDFGFEPKEWEDDIDDADCPAIAPTLELFKFAKSHGIAVFFITGRREHLRDVTEKNLKKAGYDDWDGLVLRGEHDDSPCDGYADKSEASKTVCYKAAARAKIERDGYRIVLNVGDQESDLRGGHAERAFKLPNPFYFLP